MHRRYSIEARVARPGRDPLPGCFARSARIIRLVAPAGSIGGEQQVGQVGDAVDDVGGAAP